MERKKSKKCETCNACKQLYRNYCYKFWGYGKYYCTFRGVLTERENSCEQWQLKKTEEDLSAERFNEVQKDIEFLIEKLCNQSE